MHQPPDPQVSEPRDAAERRQAEHEWLVEWHRRNPGQVHPLDLDPTEWADTRPADL